MFIELTRGNGDKEYFNMSNVSRFAKASNEQYTSVFHCNDSEHAWSYVRETPEVIRVLIREEEACF